MLRNKKNYLFLVVMVFLVVSCKTNQQTKELAFKPIFNGASLDGWEGDTRYWKVEDGAIVGEVSPQNLLKNNSFLIWKKETPGNFELKAKYKISKSGNSGVNYRSELYSKIPFALKGYQLDIDGNNRYTGQNYEERNRTTLAYRGEVVEVLPKPIDQQKKRGVYRNAWMFRNVVKKIPIKKEVASVASHQNWNTLHIIAKGNVIKHYINGELISEVLDTDSVNKKHKGYIGMQVHVGPPMKVMYKDVQLKLLK